MRTKPCGFLFATAIVIAAQVPSAFAGTRQDIRFQRGASSATIQQTVIRGERDRYTLGVGKGQYLSVRIESLEDNAVFDVYLPGANDSDENEIKGIPLQGAVEKKSFTSELPANGKYLIVVGGTRGNAEYKLTVSVTNTPPSAEAAVVSDKRTKDPTTSAQVTLPSTVKDTPRVPEKYLSADGDIREWLWRLVKANTTINGHIDNQPVPSIKLSFSNGQLEVSAPSASRPYTSGPVKDFSNANGTCIGFENEDRLGALYGSSGRNWRNKLPIQQFLVCVAVRQFTQESSSSVPDGVPREAGNYAFKANKGDAYIMKYSEAELFPALYRIKATK